MLNEAFATWFEKTANYYTIIVDDLKNADDVSDIRITLEFLSLRDTIQCFCLNLDENMTDNASNMDSFGTPESERKWCDLLVSSKKQIKNYNQYTFDLFTKIKDGIRQDNSKKEQ